MALGRLGVWSSLDTLTASACRDFAQRLEKLGYETLWMPESRGRNVLVTSAYLLANTGKLNIATGIANIYARDAMAMANAQRGLAEQSGGRFLLGLGVSHLPMVTGLRGHDYGKPVATMRHYLEAMAAAPYAAPAPDQAPRTVLAALGPKMLELARDRADGAHPYNTTPEHTAQARRILGKDKLLCPEMMILLETDPTKARAVARENLAHYFALVNYVQNWRRMGFGDADFVGNGSDRLIDAIVCWGDEEAIRRRIRAHWDAGADHVCVQPLNPAGGRAPDMRVLELLAPANG